MTIKGGSSHACAACKYQRRKCSSECMLAAFFPSDNPRIFHNAHKLFGVKNIVKVLKPLDHSLRWEAMTSIIIQSNLREEYPVHGCCAVILKFENEIQLVQAELNAVLAQLAFYRQNQQQEEITCSTHNDSLSDLQLGIVDPGPSDHPLPILLTETNHAYTNAAVVDSGPVYPDKAEIVYPYCVQNPSTIVNDSSNRENILKLMQSEMINPQEVNTMQQHEVQEYDEIHPFFDTIDDRQSFVHRKEANDSSSDTSLKDTAPPIEFVANNELNNAAAFFSLMSVN